MYDTHTISRRPILSRIWITVSNLLAILSLPGVVVHELGHAAACRLLDVKIERVVLFHWPGDLTVDLAGGGYVEHSETESVWESILIGTAPLASNTVGALAAFCMVRTVLHRSHAGMTSSAGWYVDEFLAIGPGLQLVVLVGVWVGTALAFTGFPSEPDIRAVGRYLDGVRDTVGDSRSIEYGLQYMRTELATFYTVVLSFLGLFGLEATLSYLVTDYVYIALIGVPFLFVRIARGESNRLPNRRIDEFNRVRRLSRRTFGGDDLHTDDVGFLVDQLSNSSPFLRESAARAVQRVAQQQPELVGQWGRALLRSAETKRIPAVRRSVLHAVYEVYDEIDDSERVVSLGLDALRANDSTIVTRGTPLIAKAALENPSLLRGHADELIGSLDDVPDLLHRGHLLIALALLATVQPTTPDSNRDHHGRTSATDDANTTSSVVDVSTAVVRNVHEDNERIVETLFERLDDAPVVRESVLSGLGYVGREVPGTGEPLVDVFVRHLEDEHDAIRASALKSLARIAEEYPKAVLLELDTVLQCLNDSNPDVRWRSTRVVATVAIEEPESLDPVIEPLIDGLDDESDAVCSAAAMALSRIATERPEPIRPAEDALLRCLDASDELVRANASNVLVKLAEADPDAASELANVIRPLLADPSETVRLNALAFLAEIVTAHPEEVRPSVDTVSEFVDADDERMRENATNALSGLAGTDPMLVVPVYERLLDRLHDDVDAIRRSAARAMFSLAEFDSLLVELRIDAILDALEDSDERVREQAIAAIVFTCPGSADDGVR